MSNIFPIDFEEKNDIANNDFILFSDSEDGNKLKKAQYSNLKGEPGTAATITVGSTTTGDSGTSASVVNSGTSTAAVLDFTIPKGDKGDPGQDGADGQDGAAATITVGSTTTGNPGTSASVTNSGTSSAAVLNFTIPKGDKGDTGSGDVNGPASSTDGHLAVFDGDTGKLIKDGGAIPTTTIVDDLNSTSSTSALSANQGRILDGKIADMMGLGKFLSLWNATTGQPISFPLETPYTYTTGDYFIVETVSSATPPVNYKPNGSSYTGTASSTTESDELEVGDVYVYDGSVWLLQSNHGKTVSFANIAGQPTDNTNLATALGDKADDDAVVHLTGDEDISGTKSFKGVVKIQNGQGTGSLWVGGDVNANTLRNNQRHLARISVPSYSDITLGATLLGFDTSGDSDMHVTNKTYDVVSFGGMKKITNATSPMAIGFCVASERNGTSSSKKIYPLELDANEARFNVQPNYNGTKLATISDIPTVPTNISSFNNDSGYLTSSTGVTTVNGSHGAVTVNGFNPGGTATTGYVVTKTADGYEWSAPSGGDVMVSTQANNILTTGMKIWAGTQANYEALGTYDNQTVYLII